MKAWQLGKRTATIWCASLLLGLVFTGCSAEFNDQKCETEQDCFHGEVCSSDGVCVPDSSDLDAGDEDVTPDDVGNDISEDVEEDTVDSDTDVTPQIASVQLSPGAADVAPGRTVQLTVTALDKDGNELPDEEFTWTSSDASIATVDANGAVTGVALGEVVVRVTSDFNPNLSATSTITVVEASVARVEIDPVTADVLEGETLQFSATAYDDEDAELPDATFVWSVDPTSAASIDENGLLTAGAYDVAANTATVTVSAEGVDATATVTILQVPVDSIVVTNPDGDQTFSVEEGATLQLTATPFDADSNELLDRDATYSSDDETVATVDEDGLVTGVAAGTANITVTIGGVTETIEVTVTEPAVVQPPVADAGADRVVNLGETVTVDASTSSDPDGRALTFTWELTSVPGGSSTLLDNSTGVQATFDPDTAGDYVVKLTVENDGGETDTATVTITANAAPVAQAANVSQTSFGQAGVTVYLDGAGSTDLEDDAAGTPLSYAWVFSADPNGDAATMLDPSSPTPSFTPSDSGTYIVDLTVTDSNGAFDTASVTINVRPVSANNAPVADAGAAQTVDVNTAVTLDASASTDEETAFGDLEFAWAITTDPSAGADTLSDANTAMPTFTPTVAGDYVFEVTVTDSNGATDTASVTVTVEAGNAPVVDAGADASITMGGSHTLAGSATDVEDDASSTALTIAWTIAGPNTDSTQLDDPSSLTAVFTPAQSGVYILTLTATDSDSNVSSDSVTITVAPAVTNTAPTANAGADDTLELGGTITLAGSGTDPEDDLLGTALTYAWTIEASSPSTDIAQLSDASIADPVFEPTATGDYTLTLTVTDSGSLSDSDSVVITVTPAAPATDCLIISEYVEGSSNNKAVEFYNCGTTPVDLTDYHYCLEQNEKSIANGCQQKYNLSGTLAVNDTLVLCNNSANAEIKASCDVETGTIAFNGDDRIILFKDGGTPDGDYQSATDTIIDVFGELGNQNNAYADKTFDRCNFTPWMGVGTFTVSDFYSQLPNNTASGLGVPPTEGCAP
ncbi:Ig-like domain-containing protein [Bradymonas sediminis]|uniref:Uncharacterized protein n=1 Tax=Bradymonas sediminis TaxID=1548548 RepID=A0A2Z4FN77_9DELT|nr:Ig-like domain-containing protein [Bradymonas sediminis]AWV90429.1 hypothetical protein DN745_14260 [Bradymonas sediminis]TDP72185.1 Ig-like protein group 2 [Bradymonas sediminis]